MRFFRSRNKNQPAVGSKQVRSLSALSVQTLPDGRLLIFPIIGSVKVEPASIAEPSVDAVTLSRLMEAALTIGEVPRDSQGKSWAEKLATYELKDSDLAGGTLISLNRYANGVVRLRKWDWTPPRWDPSQDPPVEFANNDLLAASRLVLDLMAGAPTDPANGGIEGEPFGYKMIWLAIRSEDLHMVVNALQLNEPTEVDWASGIQAAYKSATFVSPPTEGWIFVVGLDHLLDSEELGALSLVLDAEVQLFGTHRVSETHAWSLTRKGAQIRRVYTSGQTGEFIEEGQPTDIERELELVELDFDKCLGIDEDTVMKIAGAWSINPQLLGGTLTTSEFGILGTSHA